MMSEKCEPFCPDLHVLIINKNTNSQQISSITNKNTNRLFMSFHN